MPGYFSTAIQVVAETMVSLNRIQVNYKRNVNVKKINHFTFRNFYYSKKNHQSQVEIQI